MVNPSFVFFVSAPQHVVSRLSSFSWFSRVQQIKVSSTVRNYSNIALAFKHHEPLHHPAPFQRVMKCFTSPGRAQCDSTTTNHPWYITFPELGSSVWPFRKEDFTTNFPPSLSGHRFPILSFGHHQSKQQSEFLWGFNVVEVLLWLLNYLLWTWTFDCGFDEAWR